MKKHYYLLVVILCSLLAVPTGKAETVSNYTEHFENMQMSPAEKFAPAKWGRIVDSATNGYETVYVEYSNPTEEGADGKGYLKAGTQDLIVDDYETEEVEDLLVTPMLGGTVSFYLKNVSYVSAANVKIYFCTPDGNGNFVKGELFHEITNDQLFQDQWSEFAYELATPAYLGFRLHYAGLDELSAEQMEYTERKSLKIDNLTLTSTDPAVANENNEYTVAFDVKVTNDGDMTFNAGDNGYNLSLLCGGEAVSDLPIGQTLEPGASLTVNVSATMDAGNKTAYKKYEVRENILGQVSFGGWITSKPYLPELSLCTPEANTDITAPIDFGLVQGVPVSKQLRLVNRGTAPLVIESVTVPEGYTISGLPDTRFAVEAQTEQAFTLTLGTEQAGAKNGKIVFTTQSIGQKEYELSGSVLADNVWYENFEGGQPDNMIFDAGWSVTTEPYGLGINGGSHWAESGSSDLSKIISPLLDVKQGETLTFYAAKKRDYSVLNVYHSTDRNAWTLLQTVTADQTEEAFRFSDRIDTDVDQSWENFEFKAFTIANVPAGKGYIAFESGYARVDDIAGFSLATVSHDMNIISTHMPLIGTVNHPYSASVTVRNINNKDEAAGSYQVELYFGDEVVARANAPVFPAGETLTFDFTCTPYEAGVYQAHIKLSASDDYALATTPVTLVIGEETATQDHTVGTATKTSNVQPLYTYYKRSETETIYTKDRLGLAAGSKIVSLAYDGYCTDTKDVDFDIEVWLENTTDGVFPADESSDETAATEYTPRNTELMTLVHSGSHKIVAQGSENAPLTILTLPFDDKAFTYTGGNLRVVIRSTADNYKQTHFTADGNVANTTIRRHSDSDQLPATATLSADGMPVVRLGVAQDDTRLYGLIYDVERTAPIAGATITLSAGEVRYQGTSSETGEYSIPVYQPDKEYRLSIGATGYEPVEKTVSFDKGSVREDVLYGDTPEEERTRRFTLHVTTSTGESVEGLEFSLEQTDFGVTYGQTVLDADGNCSFNIHGGRHRLVIEKPGYHNYEYLFTALPETKLEARLDEAVVKPYALTAQLQHDAISGRNDLLLSWNKEAPAFFDDFESHTDWSLNFGKWTGIDGDREAAAPLQGDYPNRGALQYATVINPLTVVPAWYYDYPVLRAYSGKQYIGFIRTNSGKANDDWLISPAITVGTENILRFMAKAGDVYEEHFIVAITTAENPTKDDFVRLTEGNYEAVSYETWQRMEYDLSDYAGQTVKIAIRYISNAKADGAFMLMMDDFYVGQREYGELPAKARRVSARSAANPNEQFKLYCDDEYKGTTDQYTFLFNDLSEGTHTLGVQACYRQAETEISTLKFFVDNSIYHQVSVQVGTNNGVSIDGKLLHLLNAATGEEVSVVVSEGKAEIAALPEGTYMVNLNDPLFDTYEASVVINSDTTWTITLSERLVIPYNITADTTREAGKDTYTAVVRWNQDLGFYDDFEEYDDFATEFGGWKSIDADGMPVYPIAYGSLQNPILVTFPGSATDPRQPVAIAPMVFNPSATQPAMSPDDPGAIAFEGEKYVIFFSAQTVQSDKWLIAPKQTIREGYIVQVAAKAYSGYPEQFELCVSTGGDAPADFTSIGTIKPDSEEWMVFEADLDDYVNQEVYVALHYVSRDALFAQADNFYIGPKDNATAEVGDVQEYEVFLNGESKGKTVEPVYTFTGLAEGEYTVGIKATYKTGTSGTGEYTFTIKKPATPDGIAGIDSDNTTVWSGEGWLKVSAAADTRLTVYNLSGLMVRQAELTAGTTTVDLPAGSYIVKTGDGVQKVIVR